MIEGVGGARGKEKGRWREGDLDREGGRRGREGGQRKREGRAIQNHTYLKERTNPNVFSLNLIMKEPNCIGSNKLSALLEVAVKC